MFAKTFHKIEKMTKQKILENQKYLKILFECKKKSRKKLLSAKYFEINLSSWKQK